VHSFTVPSGTTLAPSPLFDTFTDGEDDLDLYLYRLDSGGALTLVGASAGGTAAERIDLRAPAAGTYKLYVHEWQTDGTSAVYTLFNWLVSSTATGNLTVASSTSSATVGGTAHVTASWERPDSRHEVPRPGQLPRRKQRESAPPSSASTVWPTDTG
jgi:Bacterial pre-peptidase C-terminal domain